MTVYLDLSRSHDFGLFFLSFRLLSWFLNEGKRFVHSWRVVHMGRKRTGRAGSRTPCGRWALWPVEHCWRWYCSLITFTADLAQCPLPSANTGTASPSVIGSRFALDESEPMYRTLEAALTFPPVSALFRGCACV